MICIFAAIAQAHGVKAQEVLNQRVTLQVTSVSMEEALEQLERVAGVSFLYNYQIFDENRKASISFQNQPLSTVLDALLKPNLIDYKVVGKRIILKRKKTSEPLLIHESPGSAATLEAPNPTYTVTGTIIDESNNPVPGVNIRLKSDATFGTTSNNEGKFTINLPGGPATLIFSSVGYVTQEIAVSESQTSIRVILAPDVKALSEVVVVGYGTQKRSDLTGSVSSVKAEDIKNLPVRSVTEALQGRAAGVQVTRSDGAPGGSADIVIRGIGSIGGMSPLYIVDGIRMSSGSNFNMQDVESIEILKDASAAAIYGAQAAGGVVLVTTKRGKNLDKMSIDFNAYYGVRQPRNLYKLLNTTDYITAESAFGVSTSGWGDASSLPNNDWVKDMYTQGVEQSYSLSLSGATTKTNYYLSANYQKEGGTMIDNWFERYGVRSNADFKINKRIKVGETLYAWMTGTNPMVSTTFPFRSAPVVGIYDSSNSYGGWAQTGSYFGGPNLVGQEYQNHMLNQTYALEGNLYADWEIISGLTFRSTVGASIYSIKNKKFTEAYDYGVVANHVASLSREVDNQRNFTANFVLTYAKRFGQHDVTLLAGYEAYKSDLTSLVASAQGFPYVTYNLGLTTTPSSYVASGGEFPQTRLLSQFGRINYSLNNKYLFTANIRRDGSDRFGPTNKFGVFPSASVGWKLTDEPFIHDNLSSISNLKIRASYGKLGSTSNIPQYTYQASYAGSGGVNAEGLADGSTRTKGYALTAQLANQNIKWESVLQTDIGLEIGLLKNHLNVTIDWYNRQTQGMIYQVPVAMSAGFGSSSTVYTNIGQMSNKGLELAIDYRGKAGNFTYGITGNVSFNKNLVKKLDGVNNNPISDGSAGDYLESTVARTEVGQPMSQFYGYVVEGIFKTDAEVEALNQQAQEKNGSSAYYQAAATGAGDLRFKDVDGDGMITTADKTFIGNPWPKASYGITLNLGWKGIEFSALLQGVAGVSIFNGNRYYTQYFVGDYNTTRDIFNTSFFNGIGLTDQPRVGYTNTSTNTYVRDPNANYTRISSYAIENGAYLKLRNVQISYNLPNNITKSLKISNVKIYAMGQNLLTFTKYSGLDPEVLGRNGTTARGIDAIYAYPRTSLLSMGINASF
ncbi:MAG: TonB-dependent receptor [Siphonobacter sp.]